MRLSIPPTCGTLRAGRSIRNTENPIIDSRSRSHQICNSTPRPDGSTSLNGSLHNLGLLYQPLTLMSTWQEVLNHGQNVVCAFRKGQN